jgi:hypothetical protein
MTDRIDRPPDAVDGEPAGAAADRSRHEPSEPSEPLGRTLVPVIVRSDDVDGADDGRPSDEPSRPSGPPLAVRVWRRSIRRPVDWASRPWPTERVVRYVVTVLSLGITTGIMFNLVHLNLPWTERDLIFDDTTPTGGDFGAHVWGPAYLRDHLLGSFRLNGWTMDWYSGMPAYRFYMVLPAIAILVVDTVLPYGVAMKLVSVLGLITLPAACWAFGRLADFRYPMPELFAFAGLAFAIDESFSIYGGNLLSTMAGEFSFSIALSLSLLALGVFARGLKTGQYRVWASVLIAAACVSHGIVLIFTVGALVVFALVWIDRTRLVYTATVGITSLLLIMWWTGPFLLGHEFMTDMKYGARTDWWAMYFPLTPPLDFLVTGLAVFGFLMAVVRRHLNGAALGLVGLLLAAGVYFAKDSLPLIGLLWNPRVLPFLYLVRYLMMMVGAVELLSLIWNALRDRRALALPSLREATVFASIAALAVLVVGGFMYQKLPFDDDAKVLDDGSTRYAWGPITATATKERAKGDGWAAYNFRGYEGRDQYYTEYYGVVTTMDSIGSDPELGCGRALWENSSDNGLYGTTMALMLLPFWTDGCIGSMEGLFFEASGTTPYHFLTTAAMSKQSSNPVRELRYVNNDAETGVRHLQDLGVRYAMVRTPEAKAEAAAQPELSYITSSGPWDIYLVQGSDIVVPLDVQPVVVRDRLGDGDGADDLRERHLETGASWFQHPEEWAAMPADGGPEAWQRIDVQPDLSRRVGVGEPGGPNVDIVVPSQPIEPVPLAAVTVDDVEIEEQSLSFAVDRVGVPVLVRVSYFPNWEATGADGPWRIGPNMMVVVPTDTRVELSFGRSTVDYLTIALTLIGIGLCVWWRIRGDVRHAAEVPTGLVARAWPDRSDADDGGSVRDQDWSDGDPPSDGERTGRSVADPTAADPSAADPTASDPTASDPVVVDPFDRSDVPPR